MRSKPPMTPANGTAPGAGDENTGPASSLKRLRLSTTLWKMEQSAFSQRANSVPVFITCVYAASVHEEEEEEEMRGARVGGRRAPPG